MTKEQEFRKQTEEAKFEAFTLMCKKVDELERVNAELEKQEAQHVLDRWCKGDEPCPHLKKRDDQLTKAKEIIANILTYFPDYKVKTFDDMSLLNALAKAEQFLKED